jgi:hypothetical protein
MIDPARFAQQNLCGCACHPDSVRQGIAFDRDAAHAVRPSLCIIFDARLHAVQSRYPVASIPAPMAARPSVWYSAALSVATFHARGERPRLLTLPASMSLQCCVGSHVTTQFLATLFRSINKTSIDVLYCSGGTKINI